MKVCIGGKNLIYQPVKVIREHMIIFEKFQQVKEMITHLSSNVVGNSNDENNFPHKLLLTNTQVSKLRTAFANNSSASINYQKFNYIK